MAAPMLEIHNPATAELIDRLAQDDSASVAARTAGLSLPNTTSRRKAELLTNRASFVRTVCPARWTSSRRRSRVLSATAVSRNAELTRRATATASAAPMLP